MNEAKPPALSLWLRELPHMVQIAASPVRRVKNAASKAGNGQPVMVIPGILSSDSSTSLLRRTLQKSGFQSYPSRLGFLTGIQAGTFAKAEKRLEHLFEREGQAIALIGWSLGGLYARVLAQRHPEQVSMVMTLASPFSGNRRANNAWRVYNAINDHTVEAPPIQDDPALKPPVHTVALWSANDGVIAPECARGQDEERDIAIEVAARHFAIGSDRASIEQIITILSEQIGQISQ